MFIGIFAFYCVRFLPYFDLDLPALHFSFAPFDLDRIIIFAATFLTLIVVALDVVHLTMIQ